MKNKIVLCVIALSMMAANVLAAKHLNNGLVEKQEGTVKANGITIAFESFGKTGAEAILMIQGTAAQLTAWPEELCRNLANQGYRVIRFDNRDVGLSSKLDSLGMPDWAAIFPLIGTCDKSKLSYTLEDMGNDAIGLMDALHIEKAHLVGASMGGAIAQLIAIQYPERVLSLTSIMASSGNPKAVPGNPEVLGLMGTPPPETDDKEVIAKYLFDIYKAIGSPGYPIEDSTLMGTVKANIGRSWYPMGSARQAAAVIIGDNCDRRNNLKNITVPTIVIHGEDDPVVNIEAGKEVADAIPNARFVAIPGMGHDLPPALIPQIYRAILSIIKR